MTLNNLEMSFQLLQTLVMYWMYIIVQVRLFHQVCFCYNRVLFKDIPCYVIVHKGVNLEKRYKSKSTASGDA